MKTIKIILLTITMLLITACGNRTPFKTQEPLENAALLYLYLPVSISTDENTGESDYTIRINNKPVMERIKSGEYMVFNLKPQPMTISVTKKQIEEKVLNLDFKSGHIYYLKIISGLDDDRFEFEQVENSVASIEIAKTGLAGSMEESQDNIITEFVNPKETASVQVQTAVAPVIVPMTAPQAIAPARVAPSVSAPMSKTDEIMKAYGLKEKGIISDEEFKALKTNILNK